MTDYVAGVENSDNVIFQTKVSLSKPRRKAKIRSVVLYVNSFCNAHCSFCDVGVHSKGGINAPNQGVAKHMPMYLFDKILNDPAIKGGRVHFAFLMTEPLLTKELPEMLAKAKAQGHECKVTTNGYLLPKKAKSIVDHLDAIQVSIDGTQKIHNEIRGKNFYEKAMEGIRLVNTLKPDLPVDINMTMSNLNFMYLSDLLKDVERQGIKLANFKIQLLDFVSKEMQVNQNSQFPNIQQGESSLTDAVVVENMDLDLLAKELRFAREFQSDNIGRVVFKPKLTEVDQLQEYYSEQGAKIKNLSSCSVPWNGIAIATDGSCYWHMRCFNDYVLGNANDNSLNEIYFGKQATYFREKLEDNDYCFPACTRCCGVMPVSP